MLHTFPAGSNICYAFLKFLVNISVQHWLFCSDFLSVETLKCLSWHDSTDKSRSRSISVCIDVMSEFNSMCCPQLLYTAWKASPSVHWTPAVTRGLVYEDVLQFILELILRIIYNCVWPGVFSKGFLVCVMGVLHKHTILLPKSEDTRWFHMRDFCVSGFFFCLSHWLFSQRPECTTPTVLMKHSRRHCCPRMLFLNLRFKTKSSGDLKLFHL